MDTVGLSGSLSLDSLLSVVGMGNSPVVQRLGLHAFTAMGQGSIPSQGTKIPQATQAAKNKKTKKVVGMLFRITSMHIPLRDDPKNL